MKQFIVDRHTTPNTPTLEQVPTEKIPIYENRAAVTADLANLSVGQIVATKDTGDELAQPVDVVEEGNLHAVTSNAVAESLSYSTTEHKTGGTWIDGKPIYRRVFTGTVASTSASVSISIPNLKKIIRVEPYLNNTDSTIYPSFNNGGGYYFALFITSGTAINIRCHSDYVNKTYTAIVEYTKTTD